MRSQKPCVRQGTEIPTTFNRCTAVTPEPNSQLEQSPEPQEFGDRLRAKERALYIEILKPGKQLNTYSIDHTAQRSPIQVFHPEAIKSESLASNPFCPCQLPYKGITLMKVASWHVRNTLLAHPMPTSTYPNTHSKHLTHSLFHLNGSRIDGTHILCITIHWMLVMVCSTNNGITLRVNIVTCTG